MEKSALKLYSYDLDFGFHMTTEWFQTNIVVDEENYFKSEYVYGARVGSGRSSGNGGPVFNIAINTSPYSKRNEQYLENQNLRLSFGVIAINSVGLGGSYEKKYFPYDTLFVTTSSSVNGLTMFNTIYQDSTITISNRSYISDWAVNFGMEYLFSFSRKLLKLSGGPGIKFNFWLNNTINEYTRTSCDIENSNGRHSNNSLSEYNTSVSKSSKTNMIVSIVPYFSLYLTKAAKKRNLWLDNTSVYVSGSVGSRLVFSNKLNLAPSLVAGVNVGVRYAL